GRGVRRGHGPGVEVAAADDDRRLQLPAADHGVEVQPEPDALAVAEPANPGRQALEVDLLASQADPAAQRLVFRKSLEYGMIGAVDVLRIAGEGHPAERPPTLAEKRSNVLGHKAGNAKGNLAPLR